MITVESECLASKSLDSPRVIWKGFHLLPVDSMVIVWRIERRLSELVCPVLYTAVAYGNIFAHVK